MSHGGAWNWAPSAGAGTASGSSGGGSGLGRQASSSCWVSGTTPSCGAPFRIQSRMASSSFCVIGGSPCGIREPLPCRANSPRAAASFCHRKLSCGANGSTRVKPNGDRAPTRLAYAFAGPRPRPALRVSSYQPLCAHALRAKTELWMASHVLGKLLHGQEAAAAENFAVTLFFLVLGVENCAHHRMLPAIRVTLMTVCGFVTW